MIEFAKNMPSIDKLRLFHQGLLVLVLPVLSIVAVGWYIDFILDHSGLQAEQQLKYVKTAIAASDYCNALSQAEMPSLMLLGSTTEQRIDSVIKSDRLVARRLSTLEHLLSAPADAECLNQVEADGRRLLELQSNYAAASKNPALKEEVVLHPSLKYPDVENFSTSAIIRRYGTLSDIDATLPLNADTRFKLLSLIVLTLTVSLFATAAFVWNTSQRLSHVMRISMALACVEMLEPPLKGSDELAKLDQALYINAWEVRDLERYRAELFELVSGYLAKHVQRVAQHIKTLQKHSLEVSEQGLSLINKSNESIDRLTRLILELSGKADNQPDSQFSRTVVLPVLEHGVQSVSALAGKKRIAIESLADPTLVLVADRDKLIQVLVNLLSNAIKFSPENSVITVSAAANKENVEIKVIDQGRGIPEEFRKRMFTRFAQAEAGDAERSKGTGLGLNICKSIAEEHGGTLSVESELGLGSTFIVTLPKGGPAKSHKDSGASPGKLESHAEPESIHNPLSWLARSTPIAIKGLVLVVVPVTLQLALVGYMLPVINGIDSDIKTLSNAQTVACIATKLDRDLCHFVYVDSLLNSALRPENYSAYGKYVDSCIHLVSQLSQDPDDPRELTRLNSTVENFLTAAHQTMTSGQRLTEAEKTSNKYLSSRFDDLDHSLQKISQRVEAMQIKDALTTDKRQHLELLSAIAATISCLVTMLLFWLIFRSITRRINGIIDNSNRLKHNQPLVAPEPGSDEIAKLEHRFYERACWLVELKNFKEELISILSHELRTPLTAVQGMFYLLEARAFGTLTENALQPTLAAKVECDKIIALVNDLLDTEKIKAGRMDLVRSEFDFAATVKNIVDEVRSSADQAGVTITCKEVVSGKLSVDSQRIKNAIKAMINFAADRTPSGETITINAHSDDGVLHLSVLDDGPLLNESEQRSAFEPFAGKRDVDIELRLALALARLVLELHGGSLTLTESDGHNTTRLSLPLQSYPSSSTA